MSDPTIRMAGRDVPVWIMQSAFKFIEKNSTPDGVNSDNIIDIKGQPQFFGSNNNGTLGKSDMGRFNDKRNSLSIADSFVDKADESGVPSSLINGTDSANLFDAAVKQLATDMGTCSPFIEKIAQNRSKKNDWKLNNGYVTVDDVADYYKNEPNPVCRVPKEPPVVESYGTEAEVS
jgi:hypothetical protein